VAEIRERTQLWRFLRRNLLLCANSANLLYRFDNGQRRVNGAAEDSVDRCRHFKPPSPETPPDYVSLQTTLSVCSELLENCGTLGPEFPATIS